MANRMLGVILGGPMHEGAKRLVQQRWAFNTMAYLLAVFLTTPLPVPRFGFAGFDHALLNLPGSGLWIEQPWRVLAAGLIYFGSQVALTIWQHRREGALAHLNRPGL